jgi:hypothetical protein
MITIPPLTPDILAELRAGLEGCEFEDPNQQQFLANAASCDVQAVPGNGKTTLIVGKLALLSKVWKSRTEGVCVISHTNAARNEVEKKLASHPTASTFLGYPHYIGTVTGFIDRFIALPYLRGLGWSIQRIDDDVFEALARTRYPTKATLLASARVNHGQRRNQVEGWVSKMELAPEFECAVGVVPARLKIRDRGNRQPGSHTNSGIELEQLKAELTNAGFFRFGDMMAIATQALDKYPGLVLRIRRRFPLILLDEAQDTNGAQLELLNRLFSEGVAYQRMGDQNQTLYEDPEVSPEGYWRANADAIPLNRTRRFGSEIAAFASRLTARSPQQIEGIEGLPSRRVIILFSRETIARVLPEYAAQVRTHWGQALSPAHDIWAVASRHNLYRDNQGEWPKSLIDYCPEYRSGGGRRENPQNLCAVLRQASILHQSNSTPAEILELITVSLTALFRRHDIRDPLGQRVTNRTLWSTLAVRDEKLSLRVRRLIRDRILCGTAAWEQVAWQTFCHDLQALIGIEQPHPDAAVAFIAFETHGAQAPQGQPAPQSKTQYVHDGVSIKLGSIHAVKGRSVDSILVVETEVWRGSRREDRAMDLATVLPHAFGVENVDFNTNAARLSAATNIFVGVTRPRHILGLAVRKDAVSDALVSAAGLQGWVIRDVTGVSQ